MGKHPGERTPDSWLAESSLRNRGCCHRHQRPSWRTRSLCTRPHCGGECQPLLQPGSVHAGFQPLRFHGAPGRSACPRRCLPSSPRVSPRCLDRGQSPEPAYDQKQDDHRETSDKACQDHKTIQMADKTCEARINAVTCRCSSTEARLEPERCQRSVGQGVTSDDLPLSRVLEASKNASRLQEVQWPSRMPSTRPQAQFFDNSTMTALRAADLSFLRIHWQTAPVDFIRKSLLTEPDVQGMRKEDFLGHPIPSAPAIPELPSISSVPMITKFHAFSGSARVHALPLTPGAPVIPPAPAIAADAEVIQSPDIPQIPDVPVVPPDLCQCLIDSKNRQAGKGEAPELQVCRAGINRPLTENDLDDAIDLYESGQMLKHGYFLRCCLCLKTDLTSPEVLGGTTTPRALPCLHTFCQGCLGDWICRDKTAGAASSFLCPLCRRRVEVDAHTSAQNWAATFPINVYLVALENTNPKNFLERYGFSTDCARCGAPCQRPKALACLHCLCLRCLKRMVRLSWDGQGGAVACPVCRRLSLPERPDFPRSLWADSFPDNPFLELLLEPRPSDSFWTCLHAVYVQCTSCGAMSCSTCSKILGFKAKVKRWCRVCARRLKLKRLFGRRRPSLVTCTCSTCHGSLRTEEGQPCLHALCSTCISDSFHNNLAQMAKRGHLCPTCRRHGLPNSACLPGELQDLVEEMTPCRCGGSDTGVQAGREDTYCRACQARICARCCLFYPREPRASPSLLPIPTRALREAGGDPSRMTIRDIAVMPGCRLLAADSGNRCLLAWSWSHAPHQSCLSLPPCPHSVAVLDSSRVAVAMPSTSQLVVVEVGKDATLRQLYTTSLSRQIHHLTPLTRSVLAGTAPEDKVVEVVGVQGRHLATLCGSQTERCQLAWPQYLAATPSGDVILTDPCANKVFCLTASGQSSWTLGEGPFTQPMGVCADSDGQIFVVDGTGSCVWRLSRDGLRVEKFPATGELSLQNARSCTWHNGTLFVANSESVQTFRTDLETLS